MTEGSPHEIRPSDDVRVLEVGLVSFQEDHDAHLPRAFGSHSELRLPFVYRGPSDTAMLKRFKRNVENRFRKHLLPILKLQQYIGTDDVHAIFLSSTVFYLQSSIS